MLAQVSAIAAEDTRTARNLLRHHGIRNRLISYTDHNRTVRIPQILNQLERGDVALVSEAGTPAVSDPGQELVVAAIGAGHTVAPIPGPSAVIAALVASGLPTRQFLFLAFLPRQPGERRALVRRVAQETSTLVCFEAPSRLRRSLADLLAGLGDRRIALCRELTKLHEEILRVRLSEAVALLDEPRGEYTLVIEGAQSAPPATPETDVRARLRALQVQGASAREATARLAAELHLPRRQLYDEWLRLQQEPGAPDDVC